MNDTFSIDEGSDFVKHCFLPSGQEIEISRKDNIRRIVFEQYPLTDEDAAALGRYLNTPEDEVGYGIPA